MTEFIGIGDLHLTSPAGKGVTGGLSAYIDGHDDMVADMVISQVLRYAEKKGIDHIFIYGDVSEKPRLTYEGMLALTRILEQPFQFHVILGNHDLFGEDPDLGHSLQIIKRMALPNVHIYDRPTDVKLAGAPIRFLPWPHTSFSKKALNVAHVDVQGARSDSGRLLESENLSASRATAVIGHIHTRQRVRNSWFSGTLYQTNFGESEDKSFHHITYSKKDGSWEIEDMPVKPTYRLHTVEALTKSDLTHVPSSKFDLVKLILLDGNDLSPADYQHLTVVKQRVVSTERDLALARIEDLHDGEELDFSTEEFFNSWLAAQQVDEDLKREALAVRDTIFSTRKD